MFCVLGPVGVVVDGQEHVLGATREAALLADLLVHANEVVSGDRLIDDLWRGEPSPGAAATLHTYVKNVRRLLEPGRATGTASAVLVTRRPGYLLRVEADELDAWRAARLIAEGRATLVDGDAGRAETLFAEALTLWRGPAFGDLADETYLQSEASRLDELRLTALEERVRAQISLGQHGALCAEIARLVSEHPFRERLWEQWMLALYRSGRQAEALRAYQRVRHLLGDELGIEPGDSLRHLEEAILAHDPALDWAPTEAAPRPVPATTLDPTRGNLPPAPPELFGRADAVADIGERLRTMRLVSLVGVGGVGKTSVSLAVAHAVRDRYPDGVWFVELAPVSEADSVAVVVAGVFNHQPQSGVTVSESVGRLLARKEALLVLDNCEHVLEGVSAFVELLLRSTSSLDVLLTSREGLGLADERQITVAPLPTDGAEAAAIELFVARASQIVDSFEIDETNVDDVITICRELDGLPLAIELAATRVRTLAPQEIRERLSDRLRLLSGGRGRAERHQTMRRTVEWSYQLLTPAESVLLNRLSVFAGGFTLAAAEDVCDGPPLERDAVLDALDSLVAKSLVVAEVRRGTTRYRLLETIRQFAEHALHASGETAILQQRYAMHFLETLMAHVVELGETEHATGFLWMDAEFDNLRAAFEWMLVEDLDSATRFSVPMGGFGWRLLRYEAGEWPGRVIAARNDPVDEAPAELLGAAVHGPTFGGDLGLAEKLVDEALVAARRRPPAGKVLEPWGGVIVHAIVTSDGDRALQLIDEARRQPERAQILDDTIWHYIAWAHLLRGDIDASRAAAEEADRQLEGKAYAFFADWTMARALNDPAAALARYQRADQRALRLGFKFVTLAVRREIGRLHCVNGEPLEALTVLSPVLEQFFAAGDLANWTGAVSIAAVAFSALGDNEVAAAILGAVEDRRAVASALSVLPAPELDALAQRCRDGLGAAAFALLHAQGRAGGEKEIMDRVRAAMERAMELSRED